MISRAAFFALLNDILNYRTVIWYYSLIKTFNQRSRLMQNLYTPFGAIKPLRN